MILGVRIFSIAWVVRQLNAAIWTPDGALHARGENGGEINYPGGWILPDKRQCVDICIDSNPKPTCFVNNTDCIHKKQVPGDYDTLLFEQLFLPQYCRELLDGIDTTVSHRPVGPFPKGIHCKLPVRSVLSIHGLWPNYNGGYPACCNISSRIRNVPFDPSSLIKTYPDLIESMTYHWQDPTQSPSTDALCELWNHEFQKHGVCFNAFGADITTAAYYYFKSSLHLSTKLAATSALIESHVGLSPISIKTIKNLYSKKVELDCMNTTKNTTELSRVRTCWDKDERQIDCKHPGSCPKDVFLHLSPYVAPSEHIYSETAIN